MNDTVPPSIAAPLACRVAAHLCGRGWDCPGVVAEPVRYLGRCSKRTPTLLPFEQPWSGRSSLLLYQHAQIPGLEADGTDGVLQHVEVYRISLVRGCIQLRDERGRGAERAAVAL